jgi:hypothetical protein
VGRNDDRPPEALVTSGELKDKLSGLRWEFRFLILSAFIGSQFVPTVSLGKPAALHAAKAIARLVA